MHLQDRRPELAQEGLGQMQCKEMVIGSLNWLQLSNMLT